MANALEFIHEFQQEDSSKNIIDSITFENDLEEEPESSLID